MVKRSLDLQVLPSPGLKDAPVLDLMCSHFVLTLAAKQGAKFNVRRDLNGLLSLAGRHLAWPAPVLSRLREFLGRRAEPGETRQYQVLHPVGHGFGPAPQHFADEERIALRDLVQALVCVQ